MQPFESYDDEPEESDALSIPFELLASLNNHVINRLANDVIDELRLAEMPSDNHMQHNNLWEIICHQVQNQYTAQWPDIRRIIENRIEHRFIAEPLPFQQLISYMSDENLDFDAINVYPMFAIGEIYNKVIELALPDGNA